jgi:hypothetical protein
MRTPDLEKFYNLREMTVRRRFTTLNKPKPISRGILNIDMVKKKSNWSSTVQSRLALFPLSWSV